MKENKSYIGLVLEDKLQEADSTFRAFERIASSINQVANLYEALQIGSFSKEILEDIIVNRTKSFQKKFLDQIEQDMRNAGIKFLANIEIQKKAALDTIKPLADAVGSFIYLLEKESNKDSLVTEFLILINEKGRLKIDKSLKLKILDKLSLKIRNQAQSDYYKSFLELKEKFEVFVQMAEKNGLKFQSIAEEFSTNALLRIDNIENTIHLNPDYVMEID